MDGDALLLAAAALAGATVVAVFAYLTHRRTLAQILQFVREREDHRKRRKCYGDCLLLEMRRRRRRMRVGYGSMPDVMVGFDDFDDDGGGGGGGEDEDRKVSAVPTSLPRLRVLPKGDRESFPAKSNKKVRYPSGQASPKSPITSAIAFESQEGSDEEESMHNNAKLGNTMSDVNGNNEESDDMNVSQILPDGPDHIFYKMNLGQTAAASMVRSHSVSGNLHGSQRDPLAADILRKEPEQENFIRSMITPTETPSADEVDAYMFLQECLKLRESYVFREEIAPWEKEVTTDSTSRPNADPFLYVSEKKTDHYFHMEDGVVRVYKNKDAKEELFPVADATTFFTDFNHVYQGSFAGNVRTLCHRRLVLLEQKFNVHLMLNADAEFLAQKSAPNRDFYNVRKVDTHVHHSACMNQKHLLRFIKSKLRKEPDEVVIFRDGTYMTLKEVFESLDLTGYDLNVDLLDVHADKSTFHRFDKFNLKYNPCGQSRLREIFLKQNNLVQGRFLAELTKQVFSDLAASKYQMAEYRISIYGTSQSEWDQLASWAVNNELYSENVIWLIQLPRQYKGYKKMGIITSFQNILENFFLPLFEVTVDPDSHPQLHVFLKQVVGIDLVDDESKPERRPRKHMPTPAQWNNEFDPAFAYYVYYCYANLYVLNKLRESKGMTTIKFRPHSGETGDYDHLAATFLTAHSIANGINLKHSPVLQFLYYLAQIGLAMSPLSNNALFVNYHRNPLMLFIVRGLNVSLSTDDPLQFHLTKEPLVEEYSIAASVWKLSSCDLCEIARNSVYQSGFSHALKSHWLGKNYYKRGPNGNDIHKTNVPYIRVKFREMVWREEMQLVYLGKPNLPDEVDA